MSDASTGRLVVISGPSGVGKSTVVRHLLETCDKDLELSVSATTRPARPGEVHGVDYLFLNPDDFNQRRNNDEFLECMEVFGVGYWYGTLKETVTTGLNRGKWVILEIDVQGALQVIENFPDVVTIFVHPGSEEELERRLRNRETENEEQILKRLAVASEELASANKYKYMVVNDTVEKASKDICNILSICGD